jgi:hypothetical protein
MDSCCVHAKQGCHHTRQADLDAHICRSSKQCITSTRITCSPKPRVGNAIQEPTRGSYGYHAGCKPSSPDKAFCVDALFVKLHPMCKGIGRLVAIALGCGAHIRCSMGPVRRGAALTQMNLAGMLLQHPGSCDPQWVGGGDTTVLCIHKVSVKAPLRRQCTQAKGLPSCRQQQPHVTMQCICLPAS